MLFEWYPIGRICRAAGTRYRGQVLSVIGSRAEYPVPSGSIFSWLRVPWPAVRRVIACGMLRLRRSGPPAQHMSAHWLLEHEIAATKHRSSD